MGYSKSNYKFLKSRRICTKCGKRKAVNNVTYCEYCLEKDVIKNAKYREKNRETLRQKNKERMKNLRDKRKQNGECTDCGNKLNLLLDGKNVAKCKKCRTYHKNYIAKRRSEIEKEYITKEERVKAKLCLYCNSKAIENKKLCEKHFNIALENLSKADKGSDHIWRKHDNANIKKILWHKERGN
jgi:hypothetical protein